VSFPSECTHTKRIEGHWQDDPYYDEEEGRVGGFSGDPMEWIPTYEEPTSVDISGHRYKCTQCGKVKHY